VVRKVALLDKPVLDAALGLLVLVRAARGIELALRIVRPVPMPGLVSDRRLARARSPSGEDGQYDGNKRRRSESFHGFPPIVNP
jgi:hypothetical protein